MYYQATITIPAKTDEAEAQRHRLKVYPGITEHVWVGFPRGAAGLAHLQVYHHNVQVWPTSPGESFAWDDYVYSFDDRYPIVAEPFEFLIVTWNLDNAYKHMVKFAVTIEHGGIKEKAAELAGLLEAFGLT